MEKWVQPVKFNSDRVIPGYLLLEADSTAPPCAILLSIQCLDCLGCKKYIEF